MHQVTVEEAEKQLAQLIAQAKEGEEVVITQNNIAVARIVPVPIPRRKPGSAEGLIWMADDFNAPLDDFKE